MKILSISFIFAIIISLNVNGEDRSSNNQPSAESLFTQEYEIPDVTSAVDRVSIENLFGFPFLTDSIDKKTENLIKGSFSTYFHMMEKEIADLYRNGELLHDKREDTVKSIICDNYGKLKNIPYTGIMNAAAFSTKEPDVDVTKLLSAFMICGVDGTIPDIIPFLECSRVYVGDGFLANGFRGAVVSMRQLDQDPDEPLPPELRLCFWPAANAILKNPDVSLPLLIEALKNKKLRIDLRLRAASFIITIDPELIDDDILRLCNDDVREELIWMIDDGVKWRQSLTYILKGKRDYRQKRDEILRKKFKLSQDVDMKEFRREMDQELWGKY